MMIQLLSCLNYSNAKQNDDFVVILIEEKYYGL